ncbi:hypothetical protein GGD56_003648 [Rhizobium mongolense]|uniref:Uncharacterized protein n=2 Tax=Rhizobium mongolense TaxID=57676 RepID=A0ABR6IPI8_9HYPH|nr:hypothetical protein [Rhizobium mongolense]TVZ73052.1 hypothetical protein BCL32_1253 [Rhizobium mongolense USDA 1844]
MRFSRGTLVTSVIAVWEASAVIHRKKQIPMAEAEALRSRNFCGLQRSQSYR